MSERSLASRCRLASAIYCLTVLALATPAASNAQDLTRPQALSLLNNSRPLKDINESGGWTVRSGVRCALAQRVAIQQFWDMVTRTAASRATSGGYSPRPEETERQLKNNALVRERLIEVVPPTLVGGDEAMVALRKFEPESASPSCVDIRRQGPLQPNEKVYLFSVTLTDRGRSIARAVYPGPRREADTASFALYKREIVAITGIAQASPTSARVEFTYQNKATEFGRMTESLDSWVMPAGAIFQRYDDGWRLADVFWGK
jgi:hypothetical protein